MTLIEKALEILRTTNDGDDLAPEHLYLVESGVNGFLSEKGKVAFEALYENVNNGYKRPWFHGIENLTKDHEGYVYWKGKYIEHYSFRNYQKEEQAATKLAERCRHLESIGVEVCCRNVVWQYESHAAAAA